jgi:hypothetical protein
VEKKKGQLPKFGKLAFVLYGKASEAEKLFCVYLMAEKSKGEAYESTPLVRR